MKTKTTNDRTQYYKSNGPLNTENLFYLLLKHCLSFKAAYSVIMNIFRKKKFFLNQWQK